MMPAQIPRSGAEDGPNSNTSLAVDSSQVLMGVATPLPPAPQPRSCLHLGPNLLSVLRVQYSWKKEHPKKNLLTCFKLNMHILLDQESLYIMFYFGDTENVVLALLY